ncbi:MAG: hypothetical protein A2020_06570 [Lentisphaerae bacterium GWF2_45_14]|nr:MAG: hypothetical protein A2020_06570 [Lentisphaerae bacterium GWF2_45_14]
MSDGLKKNPLVMIVDDVPKNIQILGNILRENIQCDFSFAQDGRQALDIISRSAPDLILLDITMPVMDGLEVCRALKKNPETADIPIIFITARVDSEDVIKGFEAGAVDYITKPFNSPELLARVKTQLAIREQNAIILRQNSELRELLHVLCHDLVNPVAAILGLVNMLDDSGPMRKLKPLMLDAADNALGLIALIRNMRKLEDKNESLDLRYLPLSELVRESLCMLEQGFNKKNIAVSIEMPDALHVCVEAVSFVNSVMNNIFSNAIKFSMKNSTVFVSAVLKGTEALLVIKDSGIGMPDEVLNNIFSVSFSVSRTGTDGETGSGFGMPLVKKFVEAYGGRIEISSSEENELSPSGTEIRIFLPGRISDL